ncbi:toxin-antitoxin system, antitoxin component, Xre domain protein [Providencia alcalifaciens PAL-1]|nr:toxin-antitoxin system, antitoxin component, Xre domain protein [Providencia alcalifaciens PAL-1]
MDKTRLHSDAIAELLRNEPHLIKCYLEHALLEANEDGGQEALIQCLSHIMQSLSPT